MASNIPPQLSHALSILSKRINTGSSSFSTSDVQNHATCSVAVFLDYDGTLAPLVDNPSEARMSIGMKNALEKVAKRWVTSIVTGRAYDTIKEFVNMPHLHYAAAHGFDIVGPNGVQILTVAEDQRKKLTQFMENMGKKIQNIHGALIEDCKLSISVHYRHVKGEREKQEIKNAIDEEIEQIGGIKRHDGKMVWEIRPHVEWNKGKAVQYLIERIFNEKKNIVPVYLGDDVTDEDAFKELQRYQDAITVFVTNGKPRATAARYSVDSQDQVQELIIQLSKL